MATEIVDKFVGKPTPATRQAPPSLQCDRMVNISAELNGLNSMQYDDFSWFRLDFPGRTDDLTFVVDYLSTSPQLLGHA